MGASLTKSNGSQFSRLSLQNIAFANGSRSSNQLQRSFSPNIISEDLSSDPHQFKGQRQSNSSSRMFKKRHSDFSLSKQHKSKSKSMHASHQSRSKQRDSVKNKMKRSASVQTKKKKKKKKKKFPWLDPPL